MVVSSIRINNKFRINLEYIYKDYNVINTFLD